ncbi:MAG: glycosyltransferase family 4 protein [Patescibacteria group bacterium]
MKHKTIYWLHSHTLYSTGGTRFIFEVTQRIQKKYQVVLIVEKSSGYWISEFSKKKIKVVELNSLSSNSYVYWLLLPYFILQNYIKLRKIIPKNNLVISSMFPCNFLAYLLSNRHIYYCFEPFAFFYDTELMKEQGNIGYFFLYFLKLLYARFDKLAVKNTQVLLAINPSVGSWIEKIYQKKPDMFTYIGVDTRHFESKNNKKFPIFTLFHSTDYTSLKGTQYLFTALPLIIKKMPKVCIVISETVANLKIKQRYLQLLKKNGWQKNIYFCSHLDYADLPILYAKSHCYLFLGSPASAGASAASLSVLEASSSGLPVIRSSSNDDEVIDQKTGLLVDPRDPLKLTEAIFKIYSNPKEAQNMGENGRKHIRNRYTWQTVTKKIINSIESV